MTDIKCKCGSYTVKKDGTIKTRKNIKKQVWKCKDCDKKFNTNMLTTEQEMGREKTSSENNAPEWVEQTERALKIQKLTATILTEDDLVRVFQVDIKKWKVVRFRCNRWGNTKSMWQTRCEFVLRDESEIDLKVALEDFKKKAAKFSPKVKKIKYPNKKESCMFEVGPVDHHLTQLSWGKETGFGDYDINIAKKLYIEAIEYLIFQATKHYNIDRILYVIGQDFLNSDTENNTTTKGTYQDGDSRWQKGYDVGCEIIRDGTNILKQVAPVDAVVIQGNHDKQKSYYMASWLAAWFRNDKNITVDTRPLLRKYYEYYNNLIGLSHQGKDTSVAHLMPLEAPEAWARTKYREIHQGHVHHETKKVIKLDTEVQGIKMKTLSSLVALDAWHCENLYHAMRQSQGFVWHKYKGNIAEFKFTL